MFNSCVLTGNHRRWVFQEATPLPSCLLIPRLGATRPVGHSSPQCPSRPSLVPGPPLESWLWWPNRNLMPWLLPSSRKPEDGLHKIWRLILCVPVDTPCRSEKWDWAKAHVWTWPKGCHCREPDQARWLGLGLRIWTRRHFYRDA